MRYPLPGYPPPGGRGRRAEPATNGIVEGSTIFVSAQNVDLVGGQAGIGGELCKRRYEPPEHVVIARYLKT